MSEPLLFPSRETFRSWLEEQHDKSDGVWLLFGKKGGPETLTAHEALEEALCFGWIDGQMQAMDSLRYRKYFARRRAKSKWSEKNKKLTHSLMERNLMTPHGLVAIEAAKQDGRWDASGPAPLTAEQVQVFLESLSLHPLAYSNYLAMSPSVRRTYCHYYYDTKSEEARQKRLEKIVARLDQNLKPM